MNRLCVTDTPIRGVKRVERQQLDDARGFLSRLFCTRELAQAGWHTPVAQINQTLTHQRGTLRGLHYQNAPDAEMKLVSCIRGAVWDVAVDLRAGSPTFLHWHAQPLSAANRLALLIPPGCAHGFQTLSDDAEVLYCHSMEYAPQSDAGLNPLDARLAISWPLPVAMLSERDTHHPSVDARFEGVRV
jgi:dTDP-4-dehydrorhamnose 3,5-epimerase